MPGPRGATRNIVAGAVLCVSHTAPDPARAWRLVRHLRAPGTELHLHRIAGTLPSRPSTWSSPVLARDTAMQSFRHGLERPLANRHLLEWERIAGEVQLVAEQMVRGRLTVDEAAAEMDRRVDVILAKRRWLLDRGRIA
jgi:multiple sugar transport system substrate-binding protein